MAQKIRNVSDLCSEGCCSLHLHSSSEVSDWRELQMSIRAESFSETVSEKQPIHLKEDTLEKRCSGEISVRSLDLEQLLIRIRSACWSCCWWWSTTRRKDPATFRLTWTTVSGFERSCSVCRRREVAWPLPRAPCRARGLYRGVRSSATNCRRAWTTKMDCWN